MVIVGAGTFGAALAWQLTKPSSRVRRVLLLEAGRLDRYDHVQTAPVATAGIPTPQAFDRWRPPPPRGNKIWHVPWLSDSVSHGLAYRVGGRSLYWGGTSPWPALDQTRPRWPALVLNELFGNGHLAAAASMLGLSEARPQIASPLNDYFIRQLLRGIAAEQFREVDPLQSQIWHPSVHSSQEFGSAKSPGTAAEVQSDGDASLRLALPMAVQREQHPEGLLVRRFSAARLIADRLAGQSARLTLRTDCQVVGLQICQNRVTALNTTCGEISLGSHTRVVLAAGTIESARLALTVCGQASAAESVGKGMTTHLRSNLTIRMPFPSSCDPTEAGSAALILRGRHRVRSDHLIPFHHQITAYGISDRVPDAAAKQLFANTPRADIESMDGSVWRFPEHVILTIASVAGMVPSLPNSVRLSSVLDEFGTRRAEVSLAPSQTDLETWDAVDRSAEDVVQFLTAGADFEILRAGRFETVPGVAGQPITMPDERREPLGCGHHEMGTLQIGDAGTASPSDTNCRLRMLANVFVAGPAAFPSLDSTGPVLTGLALTLRLAEHLQRIYQE